MWPITGPNIPLKSYFRFSLILLEKNRKNYCDGRDIENVTDGTPLKRYIQNGKFLNTYF